MIDSQFYMDHYIYIYIHIYNSISRFYVSFYNYKLYVLIIWFYIMYYDLMLFLISLHNQVINIIIYNYHIFK